MHLTKSARIALACATIAVAFFSGRIVGRQNSGSPSVC